MEEKQTGESLSSQKRLSSKDDPGWNDPPKWAFTGNQNSSTTPAKRTLNKRVPFPLTPTQNADKQSMPEASPQSINVPPALESTLNLTSAPHPPLMIPSDKDKDKDNETDTKTEGPGVDKTDALNEALTNFSAVINKGIREKSKTEEIRKRLDVMKAAWLEDKLNDAICSKVLELSKALINNKVQKADEIHLQLVMQHANVCSAWIPGIRHIILALKTECQDSSATQTKEPEPCLLPVGVEEKTEG